MASTLEQRRAAPPRRTDAACKKPKMPKGPGIHINVHFGGKTAEKGRSIIDLEEAKKVAPRRSTPPPAPEKDEQERPTATPAPHGSKSVYVSQLIEATAKDDLENRDLPTYNVGSGKKKNKEPHTVEEKALSRDSDTSRLTNSFAPPPPIPSAVVEENIATEVRENVVPIRVAKGYRPPRERKQEFTLDSIFHNAIIT